MNDIDNRYDMPVDDLVDFMSAVEEEKQRSNCMRVYYGGLKEGLLA